MTRKASLFVGAAEKTRAASGVVGRVAGEAGVLCDSGVAADIGLSYGFVRGGRVNTGGPSGERIDCSGHGAIGIVASEAKLAIGTIANEKILRDGIFRLHVRIVAGGAFDISQNQFDGTRGIRGFALRNQRGSKIDRILKREDETEGMGILQICAEYVRRGHGTGHGHGAVDDGLPRRDSAVMAAQAKAAVAS